MNVESCSLSSMLRGLDYGSNGVLQDDTGHSWSRVSDWVEPADAEKLVREGTRFAIQGCLAAPVAGRAERFRRDVQAHMVTTAVAETYRERSAVPNVMVGELWRSPIDGDLLMFIEQGPFRRSPEELQNDW